MSRSYPLLAAALILAVGVSGCSLFGGGSKKKPRSSARIYEGDSPTMRMNDKKEAPGGKLHQYR